MTSGPFIQRIGLIFQETLAHQVVPQSRASNSALLLNVTAGELTFARLNVPEINSMTSNMTSLEAAMSPELN